MPDVSLDRPHSALTADRLYRTCSSERFSFETTADLSVPDAVLGQGRATRALEFGVEMDHEGYHVFALGPEHTDKDQVVRRILEESAEDEAPPSDWCYVNNFENASKPRALRLPAGVGRAFEHEMERFTDELLEALTGTFESEEYQTRRQMIEQEFQEEHGAEFEGLRERAQERGLTLIRTPAGFAFAPVENGEVIPPDQLQQMPEDRREELEAAVEELEEELQQILRTIPQKQRGLRKKIRELNEEMARVTVEELIEEIREEYAELDAVLEFLDEVEADIVENVDELVGQGNGEGFMQQMQQVQKQQVVGRYDVNLVVDHQDTETAPVVYEDHPTLENVLGRVEYRSQMGTLTTDFRLIRPGALHRANGGYLLLDVRKVLGNPAAWDALKRTLRAGQIRIQSLQEELGLVRTISLEPEPIPLDLKVVLLGERWLYYLLRELDPEFENLFKVQADFEEEMDRSEDTEEDYAKMLGALAEENELRPLDPGSVGRIIEESSRMARDAQKLSTGIRDVRDLLRESDLFARRSSEEIIRRRHVEEALEARRERAGRLRERMQEEILRDRLLIDTEGRVEGQINGLSVIPLGDGTFARPNRITARVRLGKGDVIDIEREVELGGPIHSKGVMILSGFLGGRYADETPLSLSASLVFEQSYGGVDGDSASSAELYALLSAISEVPIDQSLAVTGSVNQRGEVQAIGGVNEKVEGFFEICRERGLTGKQGVLIPADNVENLMLREEVRQAVAEDRFHVYPVETIDEGMELLTGAPMGGLREDGTYPEETINRKISDRISKYAERRTEFLITDSEGPA